MAEIIARTDNGLTIQVTIKLSVRFRSHHLTTPRYHRYPANFNQE